MDSAQASIAEQTLESGFLEDPEPTGQIESLVNYLPGAGGGVVLRRAELGAPRRTVVDAVCPVIADPIQMRLDSIESALRRNDACLLHTYTMQRVSGAIPCHP